MLAYADQSIDEYTNGYLDLMHRSPPEDETDKIIFHLNGMAPEVATAVWKTDIRTLDDAIHHNLFLTLSAFFLNDRVCAATFSTGSIEECTTQAT